MTRSRRSEADDKEPWETLAAGKPTTFGQNIAVRLLWRQKGSQHFIGIEKLRRAVTTEGGDAWVSDARQFLIACKPQDFSRLMAKLAESADALVEAAAAPEVGEQS